MDDDARRHFDHRWQLYPYEHPRAYWIRSDASEAICTRCGGMLKPERDYDLGSDPAPAMLAFVEKHLLCPLGHGFDSARRGPDPLLAQA